MLAVGVARLGEAGVLGLDARDDIGRRRDGVLRQAVDVLDVVLAHHRRDIARLGRAVVELGGKMRRLGLVPVEPEGEDALRRDVQRIAVQRQAAAGRRVADDQTALLHRTGEREASGRGTASQGREGGGDTRREGEAAGDHLLEPWGVFPASCMRFSATTGLA